MTSERQQRANQANAKKSTGPRSSKGRSKVGRNAFRHGLGIPILSDERWSPQVESLARIIAGPEPGALALEGARLIAEAEIDLARVRCYRMLLLQKSYERPRTTATELLKLARLMKKSARLLSRYLSDNSAVPVVPRGLEVEDFDPKSKSEPVRRINVIAALRDELSALDRYERRARSRRKTAIRSFDDHLSTPKREGI